MVKKDDDHERRIVELEKRLDEEKAYRNNLEERIMQLERKIEGLERGVGSSSSPNIQSSSSSSSEKKKEGEGKGKGNCQEVSICERNESFCKLFDVDCAATEVKQMDLVTMLTHVVKMYGTAKGDETTPLLDYYRSIDDVCSNDNVMKSLIITLINFYLQESGGIVMDKERSLFVMYDTIKFHYFWNIDIPHIGKLVLSWQSLGVITMTMDQDDGMKHHHFIQNIKTVVYPFTIPSNVMTDRYGLAGIFKNQQDLIQLITKILSILDDKSLSVKLIPAPDSPFRHLRLPVHDGSTVPLQVHDNKSQGKNRTS